MTQHVPLPLKRPQRLDRGQLEFRWEPFSAIARESLPLMKRHWQELARDQDRVPLDPDWDTHFGSELQGKLHVLTAREGPQLRGYIFNFIGGALNYNSTCHGHTEKYWLEPAFRKGWLPVKMFKENLRGLKERGVVVATVSFSLGFKNARLGRFFARLGYEPTDIFMRRLL